MKKWSLTVAMMLSLILVGCNVFSTGEEAPERSQGNEELTLQILRMDEEAGATLENNEFYQVLNDVISENPTMGLPNDFSLQVLDIVDSGANETSLVILAINRLPDPLKNISFDFTLGHEDGEYVWQDLEVVLSEEEVGVIAANGVVPIILDITAEQEALIDRIHQGNQVLEVRNFEFEVGD